MNIYILQGKKMKFNILFDQIINYFRRPKQNLHLHLIAWTKMLYAVILLVVLQRQNF